MNKDRLTFELLYLGNEVGFDEFCSAFNSTSIGFEIATSLLEKNLINFTEKGIILKDGSLEKFKSYCSIVGEFLSDEQIENVSKILTPDCMEILSALRSQDIDITKPVKIAFNYSFKTALETLLTYQLIKIKRNVISLNLSDFNYQTICNLFENRKKDYKRFYISQVHFKISAGRFDNSSIAFVDYMFYGDLALRTYLNEPEKISARSLVYRQLPIPKEKIDDRTEDKIKVFILTSNHRKENYTKMRTNYYTTITIVNGVGKKAQIRVKTTDGVLDIVDKLVDGVGLNFLTAPDKSVALFNFKIFEKWLTMEANGQKYVLTGNSNIASILNFYTANAIENNELTFKFGYKNIFNISV